jgi:hypothetical protein
MQLRLRVPSPLVGEGQEEGEMVSWIPCERFCKGRAPEQEGLGAQRSTARVAVDSGTFNSTCSLVGQVVEGDFQKGRKLPPGQPESFTDSV